MLQKSPIVGSVLAFACLVILGAMPVLANARPTGSDSLAFAIWLTLWQLAAALPLFGVERASKAQVTTTDLPPTARIRLGAIALFTGAMFGMSTYLYVVTAERAGAVSMVIALQAYPLFAMLLEAVFQGKRKSPAEIGFTLIMIASLVYLTTGGTFKIAEVSWWSVTALAIPLLWSIAHLLLKAILETMPVTPSEVTVSRLVISGVFLVLVQAGLGESELLAATFSDLAFQRAAMVLGIAYYLELILWFYAMRHIDVSLASSITVPAPAVTMLISVTMLGEAVAPYQVAAMAIIVAAMYAMLLASRRRR
ncbi:DMT family transporter [Mesorhizobium qingshengii]|uniref:DMT family transporter n=1 Tax=Mesorhizobium qingshengii TaxID=1165689 RepID=A0ABT4QZ07_9HYPH|nr:DMT family transporter [Mesorhizobium qingshengii]MCZ8546824.1 DMT family transporter [Mesorhizobium qingshengii]